MRSKRVNLIILGFLLAVLLIYFLTPRPLREGPRYKGRHLSEWVQGLGNAKELSPTEEFNATSAVTEAGTNALPYLLKWLQHEDSHLRSKLLRTLGHFISKRRLDPYAKSPAEARAEGARSGVSILLSQTNLTSDFVWQIAHLLEKPGTPQTMQRVAGLLTEFGSEAFPALADILQDPQHRARHAALMSVFLYHHHRSEVDLSSQILVPGLIQYATDTNPPPSRPLAILLLTKLDVTANQFVPVLTTHLLSTNAGVRQCAALTLGRLGGKSSDALPALTNLLTDPNQSVRIHATNAIRHIVPTAPAL